MTLHANKPQLNSLHALLFNVQYAVIAVQKMHYGQMRIRKFSNLYRNFSLGQIPAIFSFFLIMCLVFLHVFHHCEKIATGPIVIVDQLKEVVFFNAAFLSIRKTQNHLKETDVLKMELLQIISLLVITKFPKEL